jgi:hypothetical protein
MGKALFDRQLVNGHAVQYIYKHMLGWPITFKDIGHLDEEYYTNLLKLKEIADSGEDISMMCLDFSTTQEIMGMKETRVPRGLPEVPYARPGQAAAE